MDNSTLLWAMHAAVGIPIIGLMARAVLKNDGIRGYAKLYDLSKLANNVVVTPNTKINILEYDLQPSGKEYLIGWDDLISSWKQAKSIDVYLQKLPPEQMLRRLQQQGNVRFHDFSQAKLPKRSVSYPGKSSLLSVMPFLLDEGPRIKYTDTFQGFYREVSHFTVFEDPDQYWFERRHGSSGEIYGAEYVNIGRNKTHGKGSHSNGVNSTLREIGVIKEALCEVESPASLPTA